MSQVQVLQGEPNLMIGLITNHLLESIASRYVASLGGPVKSYRGAKFKASSKDGAFLISEAPI
ncbi:hypothetical protein AT251_21345 [Enterovibrio nigricans]|nr:hypothetical protein AT251_21345 [Enterovibrio nigricans]